MYAYLKNNIEGGFVSFKYELNSSYYVIGSTFEDYLCGKWIPLNNSQIEFKEKHPNSTPREIYYCEIDESNELFNINDEISKKIIDIENYDQSYNVNRFYVNDVPEWWDNIKRNKIFRRLDTETHLGKKETTIWFNKIKAVMPLQEAYKIIYAIEEYAIKCNDNTSTHIFNVKQIKNIEELNAYDYKTGYPEPLNIKIC